MIMKMRNRVLALFVTTFMILFVTSPAPAAMIPSILSSQQAAASNVSQSEMNTIQQVLESRLVQEKLACYGLTSEEINAKLPAMTPDQIHVLAQASDDVLSGGDGLGAVIAVLVIIILFLVILKLMNKEIIIKMQGLERPSHTNCTPIG